MVAALCSWRDPLSAWGKIRDAFGWLLRLIRDDDIRKVRYSRYWKRMNICRKCPLFFEPLQTCGTPLIKVLRGLGCYCNMEQKAKYVRATCWIDDNIGTDDHRGWTANGTK